MDKVSREFYLNDFRKNLSTVLVSCGVSNAEIVRRLVVTRQTLNNWESFRGEFTVVNALAISAILDFMVSGDSDKQSVLLKCLSVSKPTMFQSAIGHSDPKTLVEAWEQKFLMPDEKKLYDEALLDENKFADYLFLLDIYSLSVTSVDLFLRRIEEAEKARTLTFCLWANDMDSFRAAKTIPPEYEILAKLQSEKGRLLSLRKWEAQGHSLIDAIKLKNGVQKLVLLTSDYSNASRALDDGIAVGFLDSDGSVTDLAEFKEGAEYVRNYIHHEILAEKDINNLNDALNSFQ